MLFHLPPPRFYKKGSLTYLSPGYRWDNEHALFLEYAKKTGGPILDLLCCAGRAEMRMAEEGFEVYGLDGSAAMLVEGRKKLAKFPPEVQARVHWIEADARTFEIPQRFPLIICTFCSFLLYMPIETGEAEVGLVQLLKHLKPGGYFLIDHPGYAPEKLQKSTARVEEWAAYNWWLEMTEKYQFDFTIRAYIRQENAQPSYMLIGQKI